VGNPLSSVYWESYSCEEREISMISRDRKRIRRGRRGDGREKGKNEGGRKNKAVPPKIKKEGGLGQ